MSRRAALDAEVMVFAKEPRPGRSKTRLCPPLSPHEAAEVAEAMLGDTLAAVSRSSASRLVLVLDGKPGPWLPERFMVRPQRGRGQGERIAAAFSEAQGPALLVGMDTPQVTPALLDSALDRLVGDDTDAVLGAANDGGWWALGLCHPNPRVLEGIPMSSPDTGARQRRRLNDLGLTCIDLPELRDVDTISDAVEVAASAPQTSFARRLAGYFSGDGRTCAFHLRTVEGELVRLDVDRWNGEVVPEEAGVLQKASPPVLDVGCGPGRHVLALAERGQVALGVDPSPMAVSLAWIKGAPTIRRSIFERVPGEGRWGSALLLDGNIGIGGDPAKLLTRIREVLRPGGSVLVELDPPGAPTGATIVRLEGPSDASSWFPWARVSVDQIAALSADCSLAVKEVWRAGDRWFAQLDA